MTQIGLAELRTTISRKRRRRALLRSRTTIRRQVVVCERYHRGRCVKIRAFQQRVNVARPCTGILSQNESSQTLANRSKGEALSNYFVAAVACAAASSFNRETTAGRPAKN